MGAERNEATFKAQLRAFLWLPANVLGAVPAILLWLGDSSLAGPRSPRLWLALPCFACGCTLMLQTIRLFSRDGKGTLAPWNPPRQLVLRGVYRHVRNPMISGVLLNLAGEALLFGSTWIAAWLAVFFTANALYLPFVEEPGLEQRFGEEYRRYRKAVPRWLPRRRPYRS